MKYSGVCLFDDSFPCPLRETGLEVEGSLCSACVDVRAMKGLKVQLIASLLEVFHDEKKAREAYERVKRCGREW